MNTKAVELPEESPWAMTIFEAFQRAGLHHITFVPDAGHARLIELCQNSERFITTVLTTEEEGVAVSAGAWLGGHKSALLMQSSGVGNCINMLSLIVNCQFPFLTIITMRGEWAEFNPWQVPMGRAAGRALELMGVMTVRAERLEDLGGILTSATAMAFQSNQAVAVILSQRLIGAKKWVVE